MTTPISRPLVAAGTLAFNAQGQAILISSPKWQHKWIIPGGHQEFGETVLQAAQRELKEETNLTGTEWQFVGYTDMIQPAEYTDTSKHFVFMDFTCHVTNPTKVQLSQEATNYQWMEPQEILDHPDVNQTVKNLTKRYLKQTENAKH